MSGAADATVKIWSLDAGVVTLLQTIQTRSKYIPLAVSVSTLGHGGKSLVMAAGGTTNMVQIFVANLDDAVSLEFKLQATLAGHESWVRSLDLVRETLEADSDLIMASASQDKYIRLWRIHQGTALAAMGLNTADASVAASIPGIKAHRIKAGATSYCIMFEALLLGHEDWIYSARWNRTANGKLQLLSSSADNSLGIWEPDPDSGIWLTTARLGEIGKEKGATTATGSTGGFWTGLWSPSGTTVVTLGRTGSWRRWDYHQAEDQWVQNIAISGHTRAVHGLAWSRTGHYLFSTSSDQTTRLYGEWRVGGRQTWHEMSRPQIHGYDLNCIDTLGDTSFVSGADEKLMRVFTEPQGVAKLLQRLTGVGPAGADIEALPDAANMPVLGLSNKAVDAVDDDFDPAAADAGEEPDQQPKRPRDFSSTDDRAALDPLAPVRRSVLAIDHPPLEDSLSRHTLWPEVEKLYGHGYELSCLTASHDGRLVASAARASSPAHAVVRLFATAPRWSELRPPLAAHALTVVRLRFSPDDRLLLSVGRDRQWAVFAREEADQGPATEESSGFRLLQANPKAHTRMLLDAAWAPLGSRTGKRDGAESKPVHVFATAGRDKQVKVWMRKGAEGKFEAATTIPEEHPVTAIDFLPRPREDGSLVLAMGTERGKLSVLILSIEDGSAVVASRMDVPSDLCLRKAVLQLAWRPIRSGPQARGAGNEAAELAIAGEDGTVRIYSFPV